ncbi:alpha-hydroxy acid oxidase [Acidisoma silvae]|uniref:Alpha-hydroxy-acid oxidizing protein n=1 Tax=Acidisoma silvae TaxID=2802396 RepID=A0A963YWC1_9PROT|nr:alpha-hydroxy acid oxidase [Acidisoma silvae]MCB8878049.1 alpha-hydroxy-acid oxidizing protein [Acidisoma silvae]
MNFANWEDARDLAKRRLPKIFFDFIDGAAFSERTAHANMADFDAWIFEQQVLVDVSDRDISTTFLGIKRRMPFMLAPIGFGGLLAPRGEIQAARAAHAVNMPYCLSNFGIISLEQLRAATDGPIWFQLYVLRDRTLSEKLIQRAENIGVEALCITVDSQVKSVRERDTRSGFRNLTKVTPRLALSLMTRPVWCWHAMRAGPLRINNLAEYPEYGANALEQAANLGNLIEAAMTWDDIKRFRDRWKGKLVIKGILNARDAVRCAEIGADAIIVSNHGGRQLDGTHSTISILPEIAAAAGERTDILFDGGIRRGTDIVKAMALGAKGVLLGRAYTYALAAGGEDGVTRLIDLLATEMDVTIGHMGISQVTDLYRRRAEIMRAAGKI